MEMIKLNMTLMEMKNNVQDHVVHRGVVGSLCFLRNWKPRRI